MILTRLKHATQLDHQAVEARVDLLNRLGSLAEYRQLLERFWGFYAPIEAQLAAAPEWARYGVDIQQRLKTPALAHDLQMLGLSSTALAALPLCHNLPVPDSFPHRLGCVYVLEGATLGGQIIARAVRERLGLMPGTGCGFFASYGDQVGAMWHAFRALLCDAAVDEAAEAAIVRGAHETFAAFGGWLTPGAATE
ncbi:MAG: biliverdin-producing heme oxygenase [Roseiflexaceae bacterium]